MQCNEIWGESVDEKDKKKLAISELFYNYAATIVI